MLSRRSFGIGALGLVAGGLIGRSSLNKTLAESPCATPTAEDWLITGSRPTFADTKLTGLDRTADPATLIGVYYWLMWNGSAAIHQANPPDVWLLLSDGRAFLPLEASVTRDNDVWNPGVKLLVHAIYQTSDKAADLLAAGTTFFLSTDTTGPGTQVHPY